MTQQGLVIRQRALHHGQVRLRRVGRKCPKRGGAHDRRGLGIVGERDQVILRILLPGACRGQYGAVVRPPLLAVPVRVRVDDPLQGPFRVASALTA